MNSSGEAARLTTQHSAYKGQRDADRTSLALHKTASQQHIAVVTKDREYSFADKAAFDTNFVSFGKICKPRLMRFRNLWMTR